MDKHEYRVKTEQMLEYMEKKQYKKAMEIADTIDWHRVKSLSMLSTVSEIYEYNGENQKSRDILFIAYDRSPGSRKIVYRLGTLAIKIDDLQEAMDCYEEFLSIAPKDPNQYILKYKILKAENAPLEEQIEALVDFKKMEYVEKWAYELAKLYNAAGMIPECLEECDDLILWFSEGKYVLKAMELKRQHKPLTPLQQEKYDRFVEKKEQVKKAKEDLDATRKIEIPKGIAEPVQEKAVEEVAEEPVEETSGEVAEEPVEETSEEAAEEPVEETSEEIVEEPVEETSDEVAEEPVEETSEEVAEDPVEEITEEPVEEVQEEGTEETVEEESVEEPVEEVSEESETEPEEVTEEKEPESIIKETVVGSTLEEAVARGVAAAVNVTAREKEEEAMTAQEKLEGILQNWEETQRAVEQEIERKKQEAEAEREAKRKERAAQSMFNTTPIIPDDIQQLLDDLESEMKESEEAEEDVEINEVVEEPTVEETETTKPAEEIQEEQVEEVTEMEAEVTEEPIMEEEPEEVVEETVEQPVEEPQPQEEIFADDDDIIEKQFDISLQEEIEEPVEKDDELEKLQNETKKDVDKETDGVSFDTGFIVQGKYDLEAQSEIGTKAGLTEEQKKLFSYFVPVRGMSEQIVEVLENDKNCNTRYGTSRTGNILVVGRQGTGKTVLAVNVVKAIQKARKLKQGKVAIVTGEALNRKDLSTVLGKLKGGALIVEKAGKMNQSTIEALNEKMEEQTGELLVVLEEQRKPLEKLLSENPGFRRKFTSKLELPIFINDELVTFGQTYAKENGYRIDEMGILALYSRIDILQKEDHAVTVTEVKEIMDHAIEKAQRVNIKHFFKRLFGKHTDNADRIILTEQDFK